MPTTATTENVSKLKASLVQLHPWYERMTREELAWPLLRAVNGSFTSAALKQSYLPSAEFESEDIYAMRVALSPFLGKTEVIASGFAGSVFARPADVTWSKDDGDPLGNELREWADDVDGNGTGLSELIEWYASEAIGMGVCGFFVDSPAAPANAPEILGKPTAETREDEVVLGVRKPTLIPVYVENVTNWEVGADNRPSWVVLTRYQTRQDAPDEIRRHYVEWIVLTRTHFTVYEADMGEMAVPGLYPVPAEHVGEPRQNPSRSGRHGIGIVPFAPLYGGGRRLGYMQATPLLAGSARADLAGFQEDSTATMSRYLHGIPMLVLKTARPVDQIIRDIGKAIKLNPEDGEDARYESTPSDGFASQMDAIRTRNEEAFMQAGADPAGLFGGAASESGAAKSIRFRNTEARALARISSDASDCHWEILEIVARRLSAEEVGPEERVFTGSVRYPSRFDLADVTELIDQYAKAKDWIDSEEWHKGMLTRIALLTRGEIAHDEQSTIEQEIDAQEIKPPEPPPAATGFSGPGGPRPPKLPAIAST